MSQGLGKRPELINKQVSTATGHAGVLPSTYSAAHPSHIVSGSKILAKLAILVETRDESGIHAVLRRLLTALEPPVQSQSMGNSHTWDPSRSSYLTAVCAARVCPNVASANPVYNLIIGWLRPGLPCGLSNAILACSMLLLALRDQDIWPIDLVEV
jgi:hypothetical protein